MQLSPVFCYVSLPGLYLARVYKMQPTFIATIFIAMDSLHLYRVYNMKH